MKRKAYIWIAVALAAAACAYLVAGIAPKRQPATGLASSGYATTSVSIGGRDFTAYIADTDLKRQRGLSGFELIGDDEAMLFVFDSPGTWGFWMNEMLFPIDIAWVGDDGALVTVLPEATPETFPKIFYPKAPTRLVIELRAGVIAELGVGEGDYVRFK